jgi:serine/threonine protein kinase
MEVSLPSKCAQAFRRVQPKWRATVVPGERWPLFLDSISFCLSDTDLAETGLQVLFTESQGNLVKYLKGLSKADAARFDAVKMIYEISEGMAYLHEQDVLHGDLKVWIQAGKPTIS